MKRFFDWFWVALGIVLGSVGFFEVAEATEFFLDAAQGDDSNAGTSADSPWKTLERLGRESLAPGDVVRFRRGCVWRGTLNAKSGALGNPVVYSDYGEGEKARILQSVDLGAPEFWTQTDASGVWATRIDGENGVPTLDEDVGNLVLTRKIADENDSNGALESTGEDESIGAATKRFLPTCDQRDFAGFKRWALDELNEPFDFWYDLDSKRLFVRSQENPGAAFASVEAALRRNTCVCNASDVVVENLSFSHTASHGISLGNAVRCVIRNCDFDWIGGGDLYRQGGAGKRVRYGNGVEFWESSEDCVVERCRFSRIYDVATTTQGPGLARSKNLTIRDNTIFDCEQAFEIWFSNPETTVEGLVFERNLCVDCGRGWSHRQRPDKRGTALLGYALEAKTVDITVRKNVFCETVQWFVWFHHSRVANYRIDDNVYWVDAESEAPREAGDRFFWFDAKNPKSLTFDEFRTETGQDANSRWIEPIFKNRDADDFDLTNRVQLDAGPILD